ncbi:MAG: carbamoyltransferase HypF [Syntrophomonadaceae bacterium]
MSAAGFRIEIRGVVQGVGFRPWVYRLAHEKGVSGRVSNDSRGVTIEAFGSNEALDDFLRGLRASPPPAARIRELECRAIPPEGGAREFVIVESREAEGLQVSIPPDLATCDDCRREIADPTDRRYRYAFTNCTNCGPRFTIALHVPYDRPTTTMARFPMCEDCRREYEDPRDRRFHAQPVACPACGPRLSAVGPSGEPLDWPDPIAGAARALRAGMIVAVKGLGGFHLAVDATSPEAVARLRRRKHREEKPLAVMVADLAAAERLADLTPLEREWLTSAERPIVLARRRADTNLAPEIAPGNPLVGLILPYTPLHHLLLADTDRPLVMTSGNLSDEPIATTNDEALAKLAEVADVFLLHDRDIASRCDDSVVREIAGGPTLLRRSRGWAPGAVEVAFEFEPPVLACGGHLKNTFCIGTGRSAYLGPHIGDLETLDTVTAFEASVERLEEFLEVRPTLIAHDLHPLYATTEYARSREGRKIAVQHHHAHVVSAMAEHGLTGPVLGVAYDGTGYGTDGTSWGGEILLAGFTGFRRMATFRPVGLPGGDVAVRQVWRVALAALEDAFDGEPPLSRLDLFTKTDPREVALVQRLIRERVHVPLARGVGRWFDAFGALGLARRESRYEGQVALEWNLAADPAETRAYPWTVDRSRPQPEIDLRPALREAVADLLAGRGPAGIAARFHETLAEATAKMIEESLALVGDAPVVLTGGCFQNALLVERTLARLGTRVPVHLHRRVPPGDGGLALGQAVIASAVARTGGF